MKKIKDRVREWIEQLELSRKEKRQLAMGFIIIIILAGIVQVRDNQPLSGILQRNTYGEGNRQEVLQVTLSDEDNQESKAEIEILVQEESYTQEELEAAFAEGIQVLDTLILGENESVDAIYYNLNLVEKIPDSGITVQWTWDPYEVLNLQGEIQQEVITESGVLVELQAILSYEGQEAIYRQTICIYPKPLSSMELFLEELATYIESLEEETRETDTLILPQELEGYELTWYGETSYSGVIILFMGGMILVLVLLRRKEEKLKEEEKKKEEMERDYPELVQTFALYLGAGMSVKNVWKRMVLEQGEMSQRYLHVEMRRTYYEMCNGISEPMCYEGFGQRCGSRCYQRFGLLLSQNVRKGTKGLTELLEGEARETFQIRKQRARMDGERAGGKLLLPMFLMLVVVLVIVIMPAFISMQI